MKNKLLLVSAIVVGILIIGVIVKNFIKKDLKKNDPMAYDLTYGKSTNSETKVVSIPEVKPDSTNYWKAVNVPLNIVYRIDNDGEGILFVSKFGEPLERVAVLNWKGVGDLTLLNYTIDNQNFNETLIAFNKNTYINAEGNLKLVRVQKK
jgi:hypothetical protein